MTCLLWQGLAAGDENLPFCMTIGGSFRKAENAADRRSRVVFAFVFSGSEASGLTFRRLQRHHFVPPPPFFQSATVTRKKIAGMEAASLRALLFWLLNRSSSSFCRSADRPFFSAASNAFMIGP